MLQFIVETIQSQEFWELLKIVEIVKIVESVEIIEIVEFWGHTQILELRTLIHVVHARLRTSLEINVRLHDVITSKNPSRKNVFTDPVVQFL